jgi:PAS domain S-box-containing protein
MPLKTEELGAERKKSPRGAGKPKAESVPAGGVIPSPVEHAAYLHALTENNPLGIVVLDLTHRIQMCNPAFERLFGYRQAEILGAELDSLLAPRDAKWEAAELSRQAAAGTVVREKAKRMRSDGSLVDVQILGVPILVEGKLIGSFGMYEDITKRPIDRKSTRLNSSHP